METHGDPVRESVAASDVAVMGGSEEGQFTSFACFVRNTERIRCNISKQWYTELVCNISKQWYMELVFIAWESDSWVYVSAILNSVCLQLRTGICILKKKKCSRVAMTHYDPQPGWQSLEIIKIKGTKEN